MTGINVLSTGAPVKQKEGFSVTEKSQQDSDNAALEFAAIFGGWIGQGCGQGQNSGIQSNDPAGKEANSGRNALLGLEGLQTLIGTLQGYGNPRMVRVDEMQREGKAMEGTNPIKGEVSGEVNLLNQILAQLKREAIPSNPLGIVEGANRAGKPEQPQGITSPESELDLYKGVISKLLKEMSGEIQDVTRIKPEAIQSSLQQKLELVMQRMNSGLFSTPLENVTELQTASEAMAQITQGIQSTPRDIPYDSSVSGSDSNDILPEKFLVQEAPLKRSMVGSDFLARSFQTEAVPTDVVQKEMTQFTNKQSVAQENRVRIGPPGEESLEGVLTPRQERNLVTPSSAEVIPTAQRSQQEKTLNEEMLREMGDGSSKQWSVKEIDEQNSVTEGYAIQSSTKEVVQLYAKTENKPALPIWAQVAREIHEKALQARPQLRELDINLHPAELGQIRISLTWEDGQVHLRMTASEGGTGQALQANFAELRDNLSQSGIQCGMLEMSLGNQHKNSRQQQGQEALQRSHRDSKDSQGLEGILEFDALNGKGLVESTESSNRVNVTA